MKLPDKKVFCIGTWKTGTTSVGTALQVLMPSSRYCGFSVRNNQLYINNDHKKIIDLANSHSIFDDTPWNCEGIWQLIHKKFPESYFILTARDVESWFDSFNRWYLGDFVRFEALHRSAVKNTIEIYQRQMLDGTNVNSKTNIKKHESFWKDWYLMRNDRIRNHFKNSTSHFMEFNVETDKWDSLCNFLNVPVPNQNFPHVNKNPKK